MPIGSTGSLIGRAVGATLDRYAAGRFQEVLHVGVVGTFATGWLLERLDAFTQTYPHIDVRVSINNNRVDLAGEALDYAIRFGNGAWHGTHAEPLAAAPLSPLCAPEVAARLTVAADLTRERLLRSYRPNEWTSWFRAAGINPPSPRGPMFDSSALMVGAAMESLGIALAPPSMFVRALSAERLVQPFPLEIDAGQYWLTRLFSREEGAAMRSFREWLIVELGQFKAG